MTKQRVVAASILHDSSQQKHPYGRNIPQSCGPGYEQGAGKIDTHHLLSSIQTTNSNVRMTMERKNPNIGICEEIP